MNWLKNIYKRVAPASKNQLNTKVEKLENRIVADDKQLEKGVRQEVDKSYKKLTQQIKKMDARLDRIEHLLEMGRCGVTEQKRPVEIIVSLTSYGDRVYTLPMVLERLMNQTIKPDRIVLYLSVENFPEKEACLPQRLLDMRMFGLEIRWCTGDIRSYKKLIPALQDFPEGIIITIDDDIYYDLDMVEKLYECYRRFPEAISALRVHKMCFDEQGKLLPYTQWDMCTSEIVRQPSMKLFATTGGGTLFPPHVLSKETLNADAFMDLCGNADDVWFKFMSVMERTPVVLACPQKKIQCVEGTQEERLWSVNKFENDKQIQNVLEAYSEVLLDDKTIEKYIYTEA